MRFLPKYLQALGATVFIIGTFDAIRTLLGAIYAYPGGLVVDRWGFRHAFIAFNILSIVGLRDRAARAALGRGDLRDVPLPLLDLLFTPGDLFARSPKRSKPIATRWGSGCNR